MTDYYLSTTGSDAAAGTTWATAWQTFGKIFGAASPLLGGDVVYVKPGVYREVNTLALTALTSEVRILADVTGAYGSGAAGPVRLTAFLSGDSAAPSVSPLITFNQRPWFTFEDFIFEGGNAATTASCWQMAATTAGHVHHTTARRCLFFSPDMAGGLGSSRAIDLHCQSGVDSDVLLEECWFDGNPGFGSANIFVGLVSAAAGADYNCGVTILSCRSIGNFVRAGLDGAALAFFGGGLLIDLAKVLAGTAVSCGANTSLTIPCTITDSILMCGAVVALSSAALGQLTEDYNDLWSVTPRTNVAVGGSSTTNSKSRYAPFLEFIAEYQNFLNQITGTSDSSGSAVDSLAGSLAGSLAR